VGPDGTHGVAIPPDQLAGMRALVADLIAEGCLNSTGTCNCGMFAEEMAVRQIVPGAREFYGPFLDSSGHPIDPDHAWAYLPDGTILDGTIDQFQDRLGDERPPGEGGIAIVPAGHPFARHYDTTGML
jgi:hypothetical protein